MGGGYKEKQKHFNNNHPVKLSANKTGNDRKEEKNKEEIERGIKGRTRRDDRTTSLGKTNYWRLVSSNYRSLC